MRSTTFTRAVTFGRLEIVSFTHSCVYLALLICAFVLHSPQPETFIFGLAHGLIWIAMSLVCIAAARARIVPYWLAVTVVIEDRRRRQRSVSRLPLNAVDGSQ
jgi:hypothetical protein